VAAAGESLGDAKYVRDTGTNQDDPAMMAAAQNKVQEAENRLALQQQIMANTQARLASLKFGAKTGTGKMQCKKPGRTPRTQPCKTTPAGGNCPVKSAMTNRPPKSGPVDTPPWKDWGMRLEGLPRLTKAIIAGGRLDANQTAQIGALTSLLERAHENSAKILDLILAG